LNKALDNSSKALGQETDLAIPIGLIAFIVIAVIVSIVYTCFVRVYSSWTKPAIAGVKKVKVKKASDKDVHV